MSWEDDWKAEREREVREGHRCSHCSSLIVTAGFNINGPRLCGQCIRLHDFEHKIYHNTRARCPRCGTNFEPMVNDEESRIIMEVIEEGETNLTCPQCENEFLVQAIFQITFISPPVVDIRITDDTGDGADDDCGCNEFKENDDGGK